MVKRLSRNRTEVATPTTRTGKSAADLQAGGIPVPVPASMPVWMTRVLVVGVVVVPLIIMVPAIDPFRLPKEAALRGLAIILAALAALEILNDRLRVRSAVGDRVYWMVASIVGWTGVTTLTSTNMRLSANSLGWVAAGALVFAVAYASAKHASLHFAGVALGPAAINATIVLLQTAGIWLPVTGQNVEISMTRTALVGNPRDLGSYVIAPALASLALTIVTRGTARVVYAITSVLLALPIIVTVGVTAAGAYAISVICLFLIWKPRAGVVAAIAVLAGGIMLLTLYSPLHRRATAIIDDARAGNYDAALTYRTTAYLSAWRMGKEHPLVGVGPGCFGWQYYSYKLAVERDHPRLLQSLTRHLNYAEVHNDHLQTFAVAGMPGYLLFVGSLAMLGAGSFRAGRTESAGDADPRLRFAQLFSLPLTVSIFIVTLAFFPLSLGVTVSTYAFLAGIAAGWSRL